MGLSISDPLGNAHLNWLSRKHTFSGINFMFDRLFILTFLSVELF